MTEPELVLRWSDGELNLMGVNEGDHGEFRIDTLADGTEWGNPEPVRRALRRFLLDGSVSVKEYDDNRTIPLKLKVTAADGLALAGGEVPLAQADGRRCELVWTPPDAFAPPAVFVAVSSDLRHSMNDLGERRLERFYTLTLECLPHAFSDEYVEVPALAQDVSTPTLVDDCSSTSGWSATNGVTLSVVSGQIACTVPAGVLSWTVVRTGDIDFTPDRYLRVTGWTSRLTSIRYATLARPFGASPSEDPTAAQVAIDSGASVYDVNTDVTALAFDFGWSTSEATDATVQVFDLFQRQDSVRSTVSRQQVSTIETPGSRRTSGSLAISAAGPLGQVLLYSGPNYDPTMSPGTVLGAARRITDVALLSGAYDNLESGSTVAQYRRPAGSLPSGSYAMWVRLKWSGTPDLLTFTANLRSADGASVLSSISLGTLTLASSSDFKLYPVARIDLPGWALPDSSPLILEIEASWGGTFTAEGGPHVDEILLFELSSGSLAIAEAGSNTHMWVEAPTLNRDHPAILASTSDSRSAAIPLSLSSQVLSWGGSHTFTPPVTNVYLGTTDVSESEVSGNFRPAHHTHPAS